MAGIIVKSVGSESVAPVGQGDRVVVPEFFDGEFYSLALDNVESAVLAFSVSRRLRFGYSGSLIRVRRSSDDTEQDIGFVGNSLDTASLESFCGAGNGFVTKVYEQSGHVAAVDWGQATASEQPQIVASGAVITEPTTGKPAAQFNDLETGAQSLYATSWATRPAAAASLAVASISAARSGTMIVDNDANTSPFVGATLDGESSTALSSNAGGAVAYYSNGSLIGTDTDGTTRDDLHTALMTGAPIIMRAQNIDLTAVTVWAEVGTTNSGRSNYSGPEYWSEQVFLDGTGDIAALESNMADFYGLTLA